MKRSMLVLLSTTMACNGNGGSDTNGDGYRAGDTFAGPANYSDALGAGPDFSAPDGRIVMKSWLGLGQAQLSGSFADGPGLRVHVESERIGNCRLVIYTATSCTPPCAGGDLCVDSECRSWPTRIDRGTLRWVWPDGEQTVEPDGLLGYYASGSATTAGSASITVDGMTLEAPVGLGPLAQGDWAEELADRQPGGDATLRWSNPVNKARVRLHMTDCIGSHGGFAAAEIDCEGPDVGELVLPGTFVDTLEAGDWSHGECGSHRFERYHAAAPAGDDSVRFETVSDAGFFYFPGW